MQAPPLPKKGDSKHEVEKIQDSFLWGLYNHHSPVETGETSHLPVGLMGLDIDEKISKERTSIRGCWKWLSSENPIDGTTEEEAQRCIKPALRALGGSTPLAGIPLSFAFM